MQMTTPSTETRTTVDAFFAAWAKGDEHAMRALMADDLAYANPMNRYASADAFWGPLMQFNKMLRGLRVLETIVNGNSAAVLYDCNCPAPVGNLRTAWFVRVEGGKLRTVESLFDATELRKLFGGGSAARSE
jgi:ketosteroid isomerase-like protein